MRRAPEPQTTDSLTRMVIYSRQQGVTVYSGPPIQSSVVHWSRNMLIADQLKSGKPFTHIFMVDDDMVLEPDTLVKLLSHKKDIIGGLTTRRNDHSEPRVQP